MISNEADLNHLLQSPHYISTNDNPNFDLFGTCLKNINLAHSKIEIKPSPIHGNGLFVTADIPVNSIVTLYPYHAYWFRDQLYCSKQHEDFSPDIEKYQALYGFQDQSKIFGEYVLIGNPQNLSSTNFLGHMLNDGCGNPFAGISNHEILDTHLFKNLMIQYDLVSQTENNCRFGTHASYPVAYIITTRDIKAGEELKISYSANYWFDVEYPNFSTDCWEKLSLCLSDEDLDNF